MTSIRRSLAYSIADSYLAVPLQLIGTMIISRLLTPAETGVFAVAAVFAAFASTFRDFGVAEYLIQEKELDAEKIRAALTVNIAISWAMGLLLFFGAPFAADFYRSQGVAEVMRVQAAPPRSAARPEVRLGTWGAICSESVGVPRDALRHLA